MKLSQIIILSVVAALCGCEKAEKEAVIATSEAEHITAFSARLGGTIISDDATLISSRGVCWSKTENPTVGNSSAAGTETAVYIVDVADLNAGETYYARAYYTTAQDTVYGNQIVFSTEDYVLFAPEVAYGTVTDIDGNVYKTVTIGSQTWMAENLRATHYRNGDIVANVTDPESWTFFGKKEGAYCFFNYDQSKAPVYGAYYDWFAASDTRNIAPEGWHVATEEDWKILQDYCISAYGANHGHALREVTTAHWHKAGDLNEPGTNDTGFTALAAGRAVTATDLLWPRGSAGYFWTSTGTADRPVYAMLKNQISILSDQNYKGFNIRCVKD